MAWTPQPLIKGVQSKGTGTSGAAFANNALPAAAVGDWIVVFAVSFQSSGTVTTHDPPTDNLGTTYAPIGSVADATRRRISMWLGHVTAAGAPTVTVHFAASVNTAAVAAWLLEGTGLASSPYPGDVKTQTNAGGTVSDLTVGDTGVNFPYPVQLHVGGIVTSAANFPAAGTGFNTGQDLHGSPDGFTPATMFPSNNAGQNIASEYKISNLAQTFHWTDASKPLYLAIAASLRYRAGPNSISISPSSGSSAGGTPITITGNNFFAGPTVAPHVQFGATDATSVVVVDAHTVTCVAPPAPLGSVNVTVTNPDNQPAVSVGGFTYVDPTPPAPALLSVTPSSGPVSGGTPVTLTGTGFSSPATVTFNGAPASSVVVVSSTTMTCVTPPHASGAVAVTVTIASGSAALAGGFTFVAEIAYPSDSETVGEVWYELTDRAGTVQTASTVPLPDPASYFHGFKDARITAWAAITRALSDRMGQLEGMTAGWEESDTDHKWRALLADPTTKYFKNRAFVIRTIDDPSRRALLTPRTIAKGVVRSYDFNPDLRFAVRGQDIITAKYASTTSAEQLPRRRIAAVDFPDCPPDALEQPVPWIYGSVSTAPPTATPPVTGVTATPIAPPAAAPTGLYAALVVPSDPDHASAPGTKIFYCISATVAGQESAISYVVDVELTAESREVVLTWDEYSGAERIRIYSSLRGDFYQETYTTVGGDDTEFHDTWPDQVGAPWILALRLNVTYYVWALLADGTFSLPGQASLVFAPVGSPDARRDVHIAWSAYPDAVGYRVCRRSSRYSDWGARFDLQFDVSSATLFVDDIDHDTNLIPGGYANAPGVDPPGFGGATLVGQVPAIHVGSELIAGVKFQRLLLCGHACKFLGRIDISVNVEGGDEASPTQTFEPVTNFGIPAVPPAGGTPPGSAPTGLTLEDVASGGHGDAGTVYYKLAAVSGGAVGPETAVEDITPAGDNHTVRVSWDAFAGGADAIRIFTSRSHDFEHWEFVDVTTGLDFQDHWACLTDTNKAEGMHDSPWQLGTAIEVTAPAFWLAPYHPNWPFAEVYRDINGRRYTLLYTTIDPLPDQILVDVQGIEEAGDGTGALLERLPLIYRHVLRNQIFGTYDAGPYLPAPVYEDDPTLTLVDEASLDAVDARQQALLPGGFLGAGVLGAGGEFVSTLELIARLNRSGGWNTGFSRKNQLFVSFEWVTPAIVAAAGRLDGVLDFLAGQFGITDRQEEHANRLLAHWTRDYTGTSGGEWFAAEVGQDDASIAGYDESIQAPDLDLYFVRDRATAELLLARELARTADPPRYMVGRVPWRGINYELGDLVRVTNILGVGASGWMNVPVRLTRIAIDPSRASVELTGYDVSRLLVALSDVATRLISQARADRARQRPEFSPGLARRRMLGPDRRARAEVDHG